MSKNKPHHYITSSSDSEEECDSHYIQLVGTEVPEIKNLTLNLIPTLIKTIENKDNTIIYLSTFSKEQLDNLNLSPNTSLIIKSKNLSEQCDANIFHTTTNIVISSEILNTLIIDGPQGNTKNIIHHLKNTDIEAIIIHGSEIINQNKCCNMLDNEYVHKDKILHYLYNELPEKLVITGELYIEDSIY